jgi:hypothetical protein
MTDLHKLGPLAALAGTWEGQKGRDIAPSDDRGTAKSDYRERITFEPFGPVDNHEQQLWGLRYQTVAHRLGAQDPFHEETGYWLWDAERGEVMRCFLVPRAVAVIAGGKATADAKSFHLEAEVGSTTFGILSGPFLDREFRTEKYVLEVTIEGDRFSYREDTVMRMPGRAEPFHHTDENTLVRVKG